MRDIERRFLNLFEFGLKNDSNDLRFGEEENGRRWGFINN